MKQYKHSILLVMMILTVGWGCASSGDIRKQQNLPKMVLGSSASLKEGDAIKIANTATVIKFHKVLSDSRCPTSKNVRCVWQGVAKVQLSLSDNSGQHLFSLDTLPSSRSINTKRIGAYKVTLQRLSRTSAQQKKYVATIRVE